MKHGIGHKLLSVVLAVMMLVSLLPTAAFADDSAEPIVVNSVVGDSNTGNDTKLADEALVNVGDTNANEGEGEETTTPVSTPVAKIGNTGYATLDAAITAVQNGETIEVNAGEYTLNGSLNYTGKAFTIAAADGADVSFDMSAAVALHGAKITFNNVTFNYKTNGNYIGLQHTDTLVYNNCTINGMVFLYATNETFNNCTFTQTQENAYNVWTYGAKNVVFNSCVFNCVGKAVLVYNEGTNTKTDLTVKDTKFIASAPVEGKAAIEIDTSLMKNGATITVDNTTATGFANGSNSGNPLWNDKKQTADTNKNTTVTVDDVAVFKPVATAAVAKIGETEYATLPDAVKSASAGDTIVLLNDINLTSYQTIGKQLTIDLNGKTISSTGYQTIRLISGADLTVKDSGANGKITNAYKGSAYPATIYLKNAGTTFTLESGTIESDPNETSLQSVAINSEKVACTVNISGGSVTVPEAATEGRGIVAGKGMTLNISGGTITGGLHGVDAYGGSTTNITGGTISARIVDTGVIEEAYGMRIIGTANVTVDGGEITGVKMDDNGYKLDVPNVTLKSGKIKGSFYSITKGTITFTVDDNATITFANDTAKKFLPDTVELVQNEDGSYGVKAAAAKVAKIGDKYYPTLADAIAAAEDGDTITLLADVTENVEIAKEKNLTLDLNGKTLNGGTGTAKAALTNYGTITIKDSSTAKTGTIKRDDNGTTGETSYYVIRNQGTMTIESGTVINNSGYRKANSTGSMVGSSLICNGDCDEGGTLTIKGGTFTQNNFIAIKNGALGVLHVTGGKITSNHSAIQNWFKADITGGEIKGQLWTDAWTAGESVGETKIGGDAKFTGEIVMDITGSVAPTLAINGGNLNVTDWRITSAAANAGAKPAVSGGTFKAAVPAEYCAEGFIPTANADGTFGVKSGAYVAEISGTKYETLADAIAAAKDGDTVKLLKDCSGNGIQIKTEKFADKGLTVDFGNFTYTVGGVLVGSAGTGTNAFQLLQGGKVTFQNGTIVGVSEGTKPAEDTPNWHGAPAMVIQNYCDLTLKNMTVSGGDETVYTMSNNHGNVVIEDSTINAGGAKGYSYGPYAFDVCGYSDYTGVSVTVKGASAINGDIEVSRSANNENAVTLALESGTVNGTLKIDSSIKSGDATTVTKSANVTLAAPDGYLWNADGKLVVAVAQVGDVKYESLQAAIDAAAKNATVTMLANTRENVTIAKAMTLDLNGHTLNGGTEKGKPALTVTARVTVKDSSEAQTGTIMREDTATNSGVSSHYVIDIQGGGWLTFEGGTVTNNSGNAAGKGASLVRVGNDSVAKFPGLNIKGGTFTQDNFIVIKVDRGDLFLNGGTLNSANSYAVENWLRATIKGGTVNGAVSSWTYSSGSNSTLEISGGTVNGNVESVSYDGAEGKLAKVKITGGTVNGTLSTKRYDNATAPSKDMATIEITGGTFSNDPTKYVVEDSSVTKNEDNTYGVAKAYLAEVGETSYYTMDEAFHAAVASGETLYLLRDYTTGAVQNSGSNSFTIDLNGKTWTYTGTDTNCAAFEINYPNVTLTVKNGTVVSNSMVGLIPSAMGGTITYDNAGLVFENVKMTANGHSGIETNGNNTNDTVTLKNSTLNVPNGFGIYFPSSGKLTIDNSTINAKTMGVQVCAGSLSINAGSAITVTGGPVPKTENDGAIQDGAAISIVNRTGYKGLDKIEVTGGKFTAKTGNEAIKAYNWANKAESTFTANDKVAVSGGTFSSAVPAGLCATGYVPTAVDADGNYTVEKVMVAQNGNNKYGTLSEAIAAANAGDTVKLLRDINTPEISYMISKSLTIDLNGKTVTGDGYDAVFQINNADAKVLIKNGNIVAIENTGSAGKYAMAIWACKAECEVTLENLNVSQKITHTDDPQMDMIYASGGTIIINSGNFESGTPAWTLNCKDAAYKAGTANIIVKGGTFTGFDPANNKAEGENTNFVAAGYKSVDNGNGTYTVIVNEAVVAVIGDKEYETLAAATTDAKAGDTIVLVADAKGEQFVVIMSGVTLNLNGHSITGATMFYASGEVIDTSATKGVVSATSYSMNLENTYTSIYDKEKSGYSFFDLTIQSGVKNVEGDANAKAVQFRLKKDTNAALAERNRAFELLKKGVDSSRVEARVTVTWTDGDTTQHLIFVFTDDFMAQYCNPTQAKLFQVIFSGLDSIQANSIKAVASFVTYDGNNNVTHITHGKTETIK